MKKDLLHKMLFTGLSLLFVTSLLADVPVVPKRKVLKHLMKTESATPARVSKKMPSVELKTLSYAPERYKAPDETVIESPDSLVVFSPIGEKIYVTTYKYDEKNRIIYKLERSKTTDGNWVKTNEQIVKFDAADHVVYNEYYTLTDAGVWVGTQKAIAEYDEYDNQVYFEAFYWHPETSSWGNNRKEINQYRPDGQPLLSEEYYWGEEGWFGSFREAYEYNDQDMVSKYLESEWEDEDFFLTFYRTYEYDAAKPKLVLVETEYELDYDSEEFLPTGKGTYTYDENDVEEMVLWLAMDEGEWVNDQKIFYEYNNGKRVLEDGYYWNGEDWEFSQKWEGEHDAEGRELKARLYYPDQETGEPLLSSQYTHSYDANGNILLSMVEGLSGSTNAEGLVIVQKEVAEYDDASRRTLYEGYAFDYITNMLVGIKKELATYTGYKNNISLYEIYSWKNGNWFPYSKEESGYEDNLLKKAVRSISDPESGAWIENSKYEFSYNKNGTLHREDYYEKDAEGEWEPNVFMLYYYPSSVGIGTVEKTDLKILATDGILTVANIGIGSPIRIYTLSGQLVENSKANGDTFSVALPQGIYVVCVGAATAKVIIR